MTLLYSLLSGLIAAIVVSLWQHFIVRMQTKSAETQHKQLVERMLDERNLLNTRLGQISSATDNIAFFLSGQRNRNDEIRPIGFVIANHLQR